MKSLISLSSLLLLTSASPIVNPDFSAASIHASAAPVLSSVNAKEVPNSYIVVFKKHVSSSTAAAHHTWVNDLHLSSLSAKKKRDHQLPLGFDDLDLGVGAYEGLKHTFEFGGSLLGYSGHFDEDVIEQVRRHPDVDYIERDSEVHTMGDSSPVSSASLEKNAPWGLARISHRDSLTFGTFNKYLFATEGGE
ncbi:hypothetical protein KEM56_005037, partial [Ascosphaera pollenicola]